MLMSVAKRALAVPIVFETYQALIGAPSCYHRIIREYVKAVAGEAVLDVGRGTGVSLDSLPQPIAYTGVDLSDSYIERARATRSSAKVSRRRRDGQRPPNRKSIRPCFRLCRSASSLRRTSWRPDRQSHSLA